MLYNFIKRYMNREPKEEELKLSFWDFFSSMTNTLGAFLALFFLTTMLGYLGVAILVSCCILLWDTTDFVYESAMASGN